jgi:hypothetical protein
LLRVLVPITYRLKQWSASGEKSYGFAMRVIDKNVLIAHELTSPIPD